MTGEQLLKSLQEMTPEQLKLNVFTLAKDVGRFRKTVYSPIDRIWVRVMNLEEDDDCEIKGLVID